MEKDMETSTFFSVFQLMKFMQYQSMKRMEKMDLKPSQAGVLFSLKHWGEQSQKQLAERVGITPPSMTVALRKMEEKGYVTTFSIYNVIGLILLLLFAVIFYR